MNTKEILPGLTKITLPIPRGGFESFINGWLIRDEARDRVVLMETGPAVAVPQLVQDLRGLGADRIDYLVYTHIHLDHAGGVGHFHKIFPDTKVIAPFKGRAHLVDPSRLIAGSRTNLGDLCDVYGMPEPLLESALAPADCKLDGLTEIDTPGHAPHHSSYVYELNGRRILFAGEAGGCVFELDDGSIFMRPATPHKFFYETSAASLDRLLELSDIDIICYPHSGCSRKWRELLEAAKAQMALWKDIIMKLPADAGTEEGAAAVLAADPMLRQLEKLKDCDRQREAFFIRQSVDGYLGWRARSV